MSHDGADDGGDKCMPSATNGGKDNVDMDGMMPFVLAVAVVVVGCTGDDDDDNGNGNEWCAIH